jgi:hypothetical protein
VLKFYFDYKSVAFRLFLFGTADRFITQRSSAQFNEKYVYNAFRILSAGPRPRVRRRDSIISDCTKCGSIQVQGPGLRP